MSPYSPSATEQNDMGASRASFTAYLVTTRSIRVQRCVGERVSGDGVPWVSDYWTQGARIFLDRDDAAGLVAVGAVQVIA
jgi:hypothetical protein